MSVSRGVQPVLLGDMEHSRDEVSRNTLHWPVKYVVLHDNKELPACYSKEECSFAMRVMQNTDMDKNNWTDIGFNFVIGGDGTIFEGRGWMYIGAHTAGYNVNSIGICLMGNWTDEVPPEIMLQKTRKLIQNGVDQHYIDKDYKLFGHSQVVDTVECPGKALMKELETWPNYVEKPSVSDETESKNTMRSSDNLIRQLVAF